jgi:hypothetical protein
VDKLSPISCSVSPMLGRVRTKATCPNNCLFPNNINHKKMRQFVEVAKYICELFHEKWFMKNQLSTKFIPYGLFNWWLISPPVRTHPSRLYLYTTQKNSLNGFPETFSIFRFQVFFSLKQPKVIFVSCHSITAIKLLF